MDVSTGAADLPNKSRVPLRVPQCCHWGESTLFLTYPEWLSAWDCPWTCTHPAHPGPLETVDTCATCPDFRPPPRSGDR